MCSIFAGFGNMFNEINMTALVPLFTVTFLCNYVYLITYEACRSWKFSFEIVYAIFLSELNCHFQNYRCPGHFFRITSGEFVNEHIK